MKNSKRGSQGCWARRVGVVLAVLLISYTGTKTFAADYPSGPIRAVVPFDPGGFTDLAGRLVARGMESDLKQTIAIDNRPGVAGNVGAAEVSKAAPDGYTILFNGSSATQSSAVYRKLTYDPLKDLRPVGMIAQSPALVVVHSSVPVTTLDGLIKHIRANPGKLSAGFGDTRARLVTELFLAQFDLKAEMKPFDSNAANAAAIAKGEVQFSMMDNANVVPLLPAGQIKVLAVSGKGRMATLPDVPTTTESGYAVFNPLTSTPVFVPGGTPDSVVRTLNASLNRVLAAPEVKLQIEKLGGHVVTMDDVEVAKWYTDEIKLWKDLVVKAKLPLID